MGTYRLLTFLSLLVACSGAPSPANTSVSTSAPAPAVADADDEVPAPAPVASSDRTAPSAPQRVHYALSEHLERAERWHGNTRVLALGTPAGAQHDLGGWRMQSRPVEVGGTRALGSVGRTMRLHVPKPRAAGSSVTLTFRGRTHRGGATRVHVNGESVDDVTLPRDEFGEATLEVPASAFVAGENELLLRSARSGSLPGVSGRVGVMLEELRIGPAFEADPPSAVTVTRGDEEVSGVIVPSGWTLAWTLHLPAHARLRGASDGGAHVTLRREDGARELEVSGAVDVDLEREADRVVRIEVAATSGDARLFGLAITEPTIAAREIARPRNVLLMLVDTLRADRLEPYRADTRVRTPGLSAFARTATTFVHAHSQENWTKPSVATLLTSLMPWEHTATQDGSVLPRSVRMLPEVLKEHGFRTGAFICNGFVSDRFGFDQGWDTYRNYIREGRRSKAEFVAADTLAWLDGHAREHADEPFFLYVHTIDPHVPYRPPNRFSAMYGAGDYRGPIQPGRTAQILEDIKVGRMRASPADRTFLEALYDGEISYHDVHFRAILDGLESRGLTEDTMVIVTSDHGEEFWDHGSVGHGHSVYEELLHVPLFVRLPGEAPRRIETPVGLVDVMPTILEALGLAGPEEMSGRSALPALRGEPGDVPEGTVSGFMENWRTFTMGRWKLIQRPGNRSAVYDLREDPSETNDVADARPLTLRWLRAEMGLALARSQPETRTGSGGRRPRHAPESTTIDPETEAQLRALGYLQ